ncbi:MAG: hypothetical protein HQM00_14920 [Magnetococcales bacterium]|nr:hypothetical protein [Magnetococcales bacterium]
MERGTDKRLRVEWGCAMELIRRDSNVVLSGNWSGVRGQWPLVEGREENMQTETDWILPVGLTPDFLIGLFRYHMNWLSQVSGLNEDEARRRVVALLKSGRIGYLDEAGNKRILPTDAIRWVSHHA